MPYHHGDLRRALLDAAVDVIATSGVGALSLRDLARRAGVSHAAPTHHFGDKAGLLTAVAASGYSLLGAALSAADGDFLEQGVAYVRFALDHPAHFEVMFRPALYHADDPSLAEARNRTSEALYAGAATLPAAGANPLIIGLAGWSMAHGLATLWLSGALPDLGPDPDAAIRETLRQLRPDFINGHG
jgi:AcrR family transcriptional regulator